MSDTKFLKSGDIEMNPGPIENISPQNSNNCLLAIGLQIIWTKTSTCFMVVVI